MSEMMDVIVYTAEVQGIMANVDLLKAVKLAGVDISGMLEASRRRSAHRAQRRVQEEGGRYQPAAYRTAWRQFWRQSTNARRLMSDSRIPAVANSTSPRVSLDAVSPPASVGGEYAYTLKLANDGQDQAQSTPETGEAAGDSATASQYGDTGPSPPGCRPPSLARLCERALQSAVLEMCDEVMPGGQAPPSAPAVRAQSGGARRVDSTANGKQDSSGGFEMTALLTVGDILTAAAQLNAYRLQVACLYVLRTAQRVLLPLKLSPSQQQEYAEIRESVMDGAACGSSSAATQGEGLVPRFEAIRPRELNLENFVFNDVAMQVLKRHQLLRKGRQRKSLAAHKRNMRQAVAGALTVKTFAASAQAGWSVRTLRAKFLRFFTTHLNDLISADQLAGTSPCPSPQPSPPLPPAAS